MTDNVSDAFFGSDADKTRDLYLRLVDRGPIGAIAVDLLRAMKASSRAKQYRGRSVRLAYDKKSWAVSELCKSLELLAGDIGIRWGWGKDRTVDQGFDDVIYIDLPGCGQISFHSPTRGSGPDYPDAWDGVRGVGIPRVIRFAHAILETGEPPQPQEKPDEPRQDWSQGKIAAPAAGGSLQHEGSGREEQASFSF